MDKVEILNSTTYRTLSEGGMDMEVHIDPAPPSLSALNEEHAGMAWHPILEKWVPEADINKRMIVDESEIFPSDTGEEVDEGEGGEDGVSGEDEGQGHTSEAAESEAQADGQETFKFTVHIDPKKYAKRFGVDIPDDSADEGLTDDKGE